MSLGVTFHTSGLARPVAQSWSVGVARLPSGPAASQPGDAGEPLTSLGFHFATMKLIQEKHWARAANPQSCCQVYGYTYLHQSTQQT